MCHVATSTNIPGQLLPPIQARSHCLTVDTGCHARNDAAEAVQLQRALHLLRCVKDVLAEQKGGGEEILALLATRLQANTIATAEPGSGSLRHDGVLHGTCFAILRCTCDAATRWPMSERLPKQL